MKQKYRMLGPDEKPDYRKGDMVKIKIRKNYVQTSRMGEFTVKELCENKYRRPVDENGKDLQ